MKEQESQDKGTKTKQKKSQSCKLNKQETKQARHGTVHPV